MNAYRKMMIAEGGNLDWCRPYFSADERVKFTLCEGKINGMMIDGKEISSDRRPGDPYGTPDYSEKTLEKAARIVNPYFDDYSGCNNTDIILDADPVEQACRDCPWFGICAAMDADLDGDEYTDD